MFKNCKFFGPAVAAILFLAAAAGRAPAVTGEDGREAVRIFEGIYRSDAKE